MGIKPRTKNLTKANVVKFDKISVFFKKSVLKTIMKILCMEHNGFRSYKSVKNINKLFTNISLDKYNKSPELISYIWCINFISKQWLDGIVDIELIEEGAKRSPEFDSLKGDIIKQSMSDKNIVTAPEAKMIFDLVGEALQYGYILSLKDQYIDLLGDISLDQPGAFKELTDRLFLISQSLLDIKHNTNLVANKITFNTGDIDTVKEAVSLTLDSLKSNNNIFKTGIRRLNTLLSPGYMNGRLYVYAGLPGSYKSGMLLKSALDIRKYNPDYTSKLPGMKPCVLYITMENTFTETIERLWNMSFDDPMSNYSLDEAIDKISEELGISKIINDAVTVTDTITKESTLEDLIVESNKKNNIEIVLKYFSYREISTDDLFTIISDLKDENMEVCALVLDYIKRIRPAISVEDNVKLELDRIMNELKALSVIQDIPVITAHQLNRAAAMVVDTAVRQGKGDATKMAGREHIGSAWEVIEVADFLAILDTQYKPGTDDKYLIVNVVKRRRIDSNDNELSRYTYLAHPFSKNNGLRLIDDINLDKVLSLQSLVSDIDAIGIEKKNAVPRLKNMKPSEFIEFDDDDYDE